MLAQAFGMSVVAYDIEPKPVDGVTYVERDALFEHSYIVTLHCPMTYDAPPMIGATELARLHPGAVLVDSSRSALVDDRAVVEAIHTGHLRGYAVDEMCSRLPTTGSPISCARAESSRRATPLGGPTRCWNGEVACGPSTSPPSSPASRST